MPDSLITISDMSDCMGKSGHAVISSQVDTQQNMSFNDCTHYNSGTTSPPELGLCQAVNRGLLRAIITVIHNKS